MFCQQTKHIGHFMSMACKGIITMSAAIFFPCKYMDHLCSPEKFPMEPFPVYALSTYLSPASPGRVGRSVEM